MKKETIMGNNAILTVKEMPYRVKYKMVLDSIKLMQTLVPAFEEKHLGERAVFEQQEMWREAIKPITKDASNKEKYEIAYGNFIWMAKNNLSYIRKHMGEDGITLFIRAEVEALKRKNAGPALFFLKLMRIISSRFAFTMINKKFSFQLQWITPFSVSELTKDRAVFKIPRCKILDFQDTEDVCFIGCQSIYPIWVAEQFKVRMEFERQDNSCTCTVTPLV
jgi:hypothetical protein